MLRHRIEASFISLLLAGSALPVLAQSAAAQEVNVGDIVVTAQKREQNLQDVGLAVSAISDTTLDLINSSDQTSLAKVVPSLQISSYSPASTIFNIRGVAQIDFSDLQEGPVAFYNDEVYVSALGAIAGQMFDLERVEVLRGPQGTLFGRNATGGLVQVIPARPTSALEFYATITAGEYGKISGEAAVSGPITENIRFRLSGIRDYDSGYVRDLNGGPDKGNTSFYGLRAQLEIDLSDNDMIRFSTNYLRDENERNNAFGAGASYVGADGLGVPVAADQNYYGQFTDGVYPGQSCAGCDAFGYRGPNDPFTNDVDGFGIIDRKYQSHTLRYEHDFGGGTTLTSISNYQKLKRLTLADYDASPNPLVQGGIGIDMDQYSQELRLAGSSGPLSWVAGGFYMNLRHKATSSTLVNPIVVTVQNIGLENLSFLDFIGVDRRRFLEQQVDYVADQKTESWAAFGQLEYQISDVFKVVGGIRYTRDKKTFDFVNSTNFFFASPDTFIYDFNARNPGADSQLFENVSGKLQIEAKLSDNALLYAGYNRGTKAGGFNAPNVIPNAVSAPDPDLLAEELAELDRNMVFKQEVLTNYEAGFKLSLADRKLLVNGSLFHYVYDDYQAFQNIQGNNTTRNFDATVTGAELEITARPISGLNLTAFAAHMFESKIKGFTTPTGAVRDTSLPQSPKWSLGATGSYNLPLGDMGSLTLATTWKYNSSMYLEASNAPISFEPGYTVGDLRVTYATAENNVEVAFFINNITDEVYRVFTSDNSVFASYENVYGRPRWIGGSVTFRFGR